MPLSPRNLLLTKLDAGTLVVLLLAWTVSRARRHAYTAYHCCHHRRWFYAGDRHAAALRTLRMRAATTNCLQPMPCCTDCRCLPACAPLITGCGTFGWRWIAHLAHRSLPLVQPCGFSAFTVLPVPPLQAVAYCCATLRLTVGRERIFCMLCFVCLSLPFLGSSSCCTCLPFRAVSSILYLSGCIAGAYAGGARDCIRRVRCRAGGAGLYLCAATLHYNAGLPLRAFCTRFLLSRTRLAGYAACAACICLPDVGFFCHAFFLRHCAVLPSPRAGCRAWTIWRSSAAPA